MPFDYTAIDQTALIVVDMDNDNCTGLYTVYNADEYIANAVATRDACRAAGIPVIHAKHTYATHGKDAILNELRLDDGSTPAASVEGTWGHQIIDPLAPRDSDLVVRKHRWDAFYNTTLLNVLHALGSRQLVFMGGFTEACVATSVFGAYFNDYPCAVVVDAASCDNALAHKVGILTMANWVYDLTLFTTPNFTRWTEGEQARYWFAGLFNQMPYRSPEEIDSRYTEVLTGTHTTGGSGVGKRPRPAGTRVMSATEGPLRDIFDESRRVLAAAEEEGLTVRLIGGLAVREHAPDGRLLLTRECKDIDLVTIKKHSRELATLLETLGYEADAQFNAFNVDRRQLFYDLGHQRQLDVFVGGFEMCHSLPIADRLHIHPRAIPLAELLLTKLQVVHLNEKDEHDIVSMLVSHELNGEDESSTIGASRVAQLCATDWGLWRTTKENIARVREDLPEVPLSSEQRERALAQLQDLWSRIEAEPKSRRWKLRDRLGDKVRWYEEPEEVG